MVTLFHACLLINPYFNKTAGDHSEIEPVLYGLEHGVSSPGQFRSLFMLQNSREPQNFLETYSIRTD